MSGKHGVGIETRLLTPGPGTYDDMRRTHYSTLPGSKMGQDDRKSYFLRTASSEKPGPGNYSAICFTEQS